MTINSIRPGIYNTEYFSGSQVALYIGDVWVDEITTISYAVSQARTPIYGYADQLFRDVSKGPIIVQGQFTINFKEAGYLFVILDHYHARIKGRSVLQPFQGSDEVSRLNIEQVLNSEMSTFERNKLFQDMANWASYEHKTGLGPSEGDISEKAKSAVIESAQAGLTGYAATLRAQGGIGKAENDFEDFEDAVWGKSQGDLDADTRRADDPRLNPFDIFVSFGDYAGDNSANHTIQKLSDVHIVGTSKQIVIDGQPISEAYGFIARNII